MINKISDCQSYLRRQCDISDVTKSIITSKIFPLQVNFRKYPWAHPNSVTALDPCTNTALPRALLAAHFACGAPATASDLFNLQSIQDNKKINKKHRTVYKCSTWDGLKDLTCLNDLPRHTHTHGLWPAGHSHTCCHLVYCFITW